MRSLVVCCLVGLLLAVCVSSQDCNVANCKTCITDSPDLCSDCESDYLKKDGGASCVTPDECTEAQYVIVKDGFDCLAAAECTSEGMYVKGEYCVEECGEGYTSTDELYHICVCAAEYYRDDNDECKPCSETDDEENCASCVLGSYYKDENGDCRKCPEDEDCKKCENTYYKEEGICMKCDEKCGTCSSNGVCLTCADGWYDAAAKGAKTPDCVTAQECMNNGKAIDEEEMKCIDIPECISANKFVDVFVDEDDNTKRYCVSACPTQRPYDYEYYCIDAEKCNNEKESFIDKTDKKCLTSDECKKKEKFVDETAGECVAACPTERPYDDNGNCVDADYCMSESNYVDETGMKCVTSQECVQAKKFADEFDDEDENTKRYCVPECPTQRPYSYYGYCTDDDTCMSLDSESGKCVVDETDRKCLFPKDCIEAKKFVDGGYCVPSCSTERPYVDTDYKVCVAADVCKANKKYLDEKDASNKKCVSSCGTGRFVDEDQKCQDCGDNCDVCTSNTVCTTCSSHFFKVTGETTATCSECEAQCGECEGAAGVCTTCVEGKYLEDPDNGVCKECPEGNCDAVQCPKGYYYVSEDRECVKCTTGCAACSDADTCTECSAGWYNSAKEGFECTQCNAACATCTDGTTACTKCNADYYRDAEGVCQGCTGETEEQCKACKGGYYKEAATDDCKMCGGEDQVCKDCGNGYRTVVENEVETCVKCGDTCETCESRAINKIPNAEVCTKCAEGYYVKDPATTAPVCEPCDGEGKCVCGNREYFDSEKRQCANCREDCATCSNADTCDACIDGLVKSGDKCVQPEPKPEPEPLPSAAAAKNICVVVMACLMVIAALF